MKFLLASLIIFSSFVFAHDSCNSCNTCNHDHHHVKERIIYKEKIKWKTRWRTQYIYVEKPSKPKVKVVRKTKVKTKIKKVYVKPETKKNSISLLGIAARTGTDVQEENNNTEVKKEYETDFGLMYQRDISESIRLSISGSLRGTGALGVGFNF